tara:strand:+ start:2650 stop:2889 length:240 start_codon:yes stop_codon:yes gene_type:complete
MKGLLLLLNEKRAEAKDLMAKTDTRTRHEGLGMMEVVTELKAWLSRQKRAERFLTQENTIVKDGYVYVRVNEIPFDELK